MENKSHLERANQTYSQHFKDSIYYSWLSLKSSFYFFFHAMYPNSFQSSGSDTVNHLNGILVEKLNGHKVSISVSTQTLPQTISQTLPQTDYILNIETVTEQTQPIVKKVSFENTTKKRKLETIDESTE